MKKIHKAYLILLFLFTLTGFQANAQKIRKVVFVIADGIPLDKIQSHSMPNLKQFTKNGSFRLCWWQKKWLYRNPHNFRRRI